MGNWFESGAITLEMLPKMFRVKLLAYVFSLGLVAIFGPTGPASAQDEPTLLTIEITAPDEAPGAIVTLTRSELEALPPVTFTTRTNWTNGPMTFTGVALTTLLDRFDVTEGEIELIAINAYSVILPVDDPTNDGATLAYLMNGNPMTPRGKGPIWMVYNYDADRRYRTETVFSRSIWQLDRIIISR